MKQYLEAFITSINRSKGIWNGWLPPLMPLKVYERVFGSVAYEKTDHDDTLQFSPFIYHSIENFEGEGGWGWGCEGEGED